jgi:hypothetical protein
MNRSRTQIHTFQPRPRQFRHWSTGLSLHSHTMHSKEYLGRLPHYIAKFPIGSYILEWEIGRVHLYEGRIFDFKKIYWTPPLSTREACELEAKQIEAQLGLEAMVSLSDHDNFEAGLRLRFLKKTRQAPISIEWTVPYEKTEFHVGIHNLPASRAEAWAREFAGFRLKPNPEHLCRILGELNAEQDVLIVLNHPYWDAQNVGPQAHQAALLAFLERFLPFLHAIELNGMRSRRENRELLQLAEALGRPVVSGGDRHGCEANAVLNISEAKRFAEFVRGIRENQRSEIVLMPQFFEPLPVRLIENGFHALADAPGEFGRRHWMTRVFIEQDGEPKALSQFTGTRFERVIEQFRWVIGLIANPVVRPALRLPFLGYEQGGL